MDSEEGKAVWVLGGEKRRVCIGREWNTSRGEKDVAFSLQDERQSYAILSGGGDNSTPGVVGVPVEW